MNILKLLRGLFIPNYDEVSLFSMSLACIFLIATNFDFGRLHITGFNNETIGFFIVLIVVLFGICLSIIHAFIKRRKSSTEKICLLLFASFISGFGGIWSGAYLWYQTESWLKVLPIFNIISGYILLASVRDMGLIDQRISDDNSSLQEILLCTTVTTIIFAVSQYFFKLHWAATFSISVAYATNFNSSLLGLFFEQRAPMKA